MHFFSIQPSLWLGFIFTLLFLQAFDVFLVRVLKIRRLLASFLLTIAVWFAVLLFAWVLRGILGADAALQFLSGYLVEEALSVDNLFVFLIIFQQFQVPEASQHRVLFWGIWGAVLMRGFFIAIGAVLIQQFSFIFEIFGVVLLWSSWKLVQPKKAASHSKDFQHASLVQSLRRWLPLTDSFQGERFWVQAHGKRYLTPLFLVLCVVEVSDIIFAVDSIPAIFAITSEPFLVFTSNLFAILGLRALFFLLGAVMSRLHLLSYGLAGILAFIGAKMLLHRFFEISTLLSLSLILVILGFVAVLSLLTKPAEVE